MKVKKTMTYAMGVLVLLMTFSSYADISFLISSDFPRGFYCHFKADRGSLLLGKVTKGGWSSRRHAGSSYHQGGLSLARVIASCFDNTGKDHISPTGHICYNAADNIVGTTVVVTHSGSQILFNGQPPEGDRRC